MSSPDSLTARPIGHVENGFDETRPPDVIAAQESCIRIDPELAPGLQGLEAGQRILVVFWFDRSEGFELLQHPRGDRSRPRRGVFALRSPYRPNAIGVTEVDLVAREGSLLRVHGLDALNRTPVLDIKPAGKR